MTVNAGGNIYIADSRNGIVRKVVPNGTISTVAGKRPGSADAASVSGGDLFIGFPRAVATGPAGELYVADAYRDSILHLDETEAISKSVGLGQPDIYRPGGAVDTSGNVFIADRSNHRILKVAPDGVATTVAGSGEPGDSGDGGPAGTAMLSSPSGVALGDDGSIYIADTSNHRIRKVNSRGTVTTVAGTGERGFGGERAPGVKIRGRHVSVQSVGPTSGFPGIEELEVGPIPRSIRNKEVEVVAVVGGRTSNAVTIAFE